LPDSGDRSGTVELQERAKAGAESECEGSPVFANEMKNDVGDENDDDYV